MLIHQRTETHFEFKVHQELHWSHQDMYVQNIIMCFHAIPDSA